jgi:hypothetical protein
MCLSATKLFSKVTSIMPVTVLKPGQALLSIRRGAHQPHLEVLGATLFPGTTFVFPGTMGPFPGAKMFPGTSRVFLGASVSFLGIQKAIPGTCNYYRMYIGICFWAILPVRLARIYSTMGRSAVNQPTTADPTTFCCTTIRPTTVCSRKARPTTADPTTFCCTIIRATSLFSTTPRATTADPTTEH